MRAIEKKRPPLLTKRRIAYAGTICFIALLVWLVLYYRAIQMPHWTEQREAEAFALETTELASVEHSYKHVWDQVSWIVSGLNDHDEPVMVWIAAEGEPIVMRSGDGLTEEAILGKFESSNPEAEPIRIQAGLFSGTPVWEVYYKDGGRAYYAFYTFYDGTYIDTYQLSSSTEP